MPKNRDVENIRNSEPKIKLFKQIIFERIKLYMLLERHLCVCVCVCVCVNFEPGKFVLYPVILQHSFPAALLNFTTYLYFYPQHLKMLSYLPSLLSLFFPKGLLGRYDRLLLKLAREDFFACDSHFFATDILRASIY